MSTFGDVDDVDYVGIVGNLREFNLCHEYLLSSNQTHEGVEYLAGTNTTLLGLNKPMIDVRVDPLVEMSEVS
jgi:hypothetical protein